MAVRKKFGEILVEAGVINETALRQALHRQKEVGHRLGEVLEAMGIIKETDIAVALSRQYGYRTVKDFARYRFPPEVLALVTPEKARHHQIFPLKVDGGALLLAMVNPLDLAVIDELAAATRLRVVPCVTIPKEILAAIHAHYGKSEEKEAAIAVSAAEWRSILVAATDPEGRAAIVQMLKGCGYQVEAAEDGAEALAISLQLSPHLIVVDAGRPERLDAMGLFRSLRGAIPMIALGSGAVAEEVALLRAGFCDYLPLPLQRDRLVARVHRVLQLFYDKAKAA